MSGQTTLEFFKVNVKAVKAEIKILEKEIREGKHSNKAKQRAYSAWRRVEAAKNRTSAWRLFYEYRDEHGAVPHSPKVGLYPLIHQVTNLYILRAHSRGRLHMKNRWTSETSMGEFTLEDQAERVKVIIADLWDAESEMIEPKEGCII